jgi:hypothetical protein
VRWPPPGKGQGWVRGGVFRPTRVKSAWRAQSRYSSARRPELELGPRTVELCLQLCTGTGRSGEPSPSPATADPGCQVRALPLPPAPAGARQKRESGRAPRSTPRRIPGIPGTRAAAHSSDFLLRNAARTCRLTGAPRTWGPAQPQLARARVGAEGRAPGAGIRGFLHAWRAGPGQDIANRS